MKSSFVSESSSTRIGKRPCSSGIRSEGFAVLKAPAAMNRMWSVLTMPCFVFTVEPSTMGSRSRWTPSRDTSGPWLALLPTILSISSRKMIPDCSTRVWASRTTLSMSMSLCTSSSSRIARASGIRRRRRFFFCGKRLPNISLMLSPRSSTPEDEKTSIMGPPAFSVTSRLTTRASSRPSRSICRSFSRVSECPASLSPAAASTPSGLRISARLTGSSRSRTRSSAISFAFSRTFSISSCFTMPTAISMRSRIMESTSRPT